MKRKHLIIAAITLVAIAVAFSMFHDATQKTQLKGKVECLADVDVRQKELTYADVCTIAKICTANGGCSIWESPTDGKMICICAEPDKYQADDMLLFNIYQSLDGGNEWELAGHGDLSSDIARGALWVNSSLKSFLENNKESSSAFVLDAFAQMHGIW